ncbi:phage portal protein [Thalassoglobus sp.]|uniref:phage portal protein n=1 Tax=Thalassoglobus sp. TaxID=2795869 RepID=UPI003AA7F645
MIGRAIDSIVGVISPAAGARRAHAREVMRKVSQRSYDAARKDRRLSSWRTQNRSADLEMLADVDTVRARSRDLVRNNPYARGILRAQIRNIVCTGIVPQAQVELESEEQSDLFNEKVEDLFRRFNEEADITGRLTFYEMQQAIISERWEAGEILVRFVRVDDRASAIPLKLELIEADRLAGDHLFPRGMNKETGNEVRRGIEIDSNGKPVAYWIYKTHPNDLNTRQLKAERYPADDFLPLFKPTRVGQTRGFPELGTVVTWIKGVDRYLATELEASEVASCFTVAIKTTGGGADGGLLPSSGGASEDTRGNSFEHIEPATVARLFPGEDISVINPSRNHSDSGEWIALMQRSIGVGTGLSYERLTRDYSKTSYSSNRAGDLEDRREFRIEQQWLIGHFCREVWLRFMAAAVSSSIDWMPDEMQFIAEFDKWTAHYWQPPGWEWVDPKKESDASSNSISSFQSTLRDEIAKKGGDWRGVLKQRAKELRYLSTLLNVPISTILNGSGANAPNVDNKSLLDKLEDMEPATN